MGSSCIIKSCASRKCKVQVSFHRLPQQCSSTGLVGALRRIFGSENVKRLTCFVRLCSQHIIELLPWATKEREIYNLLTHLSRSSMKGPNPPSAELRKIFEIFTSIKHMVPSGSLPISNSDYVEDAAVGAFYINTIYSRMIRKKLGLPSCEDTPTDLEPPVLNSSQGFVSRENYNVASGNHLYVSSSMCMPKSQEGLQRPYCNFPLMMSPMITLVIQNTTQGLAMSDLCNNGLDTGAQGPNNVHDSSGQNSDSFVGLEQVFNISSTSSGCNINIRNDVLTENPGHNYDQISASPVDIPNDVLSCPKEKLLNLECKEEMDTEVNNAVNVENLVNNVTDPGSFEFSPCNSFGNSDGDSVIGSDENEQYTMLKKKYGSAILKNLELFRRRDDEACDSSETRNKIALISSDWSPSGNWPLLQCVTSLDTSCMDRLNTSRQYEDIPQATYSKIADLAALWEKLKEQTRYGALASGVNEQAITSHFFSTIQSGITDPPPRDDDNESGGEHSMIPDECGIGAMDAARDPDACMDDKSKKTGSGEEQDINDNHTKVSEDDEKEDEGENNEALANGEIQSKDGEKSIEQEKEHEKDGDVNNKELVGGEGNDKKDDDVDDVGEGDHKVGDEETPLDIEGSEDEGKDSSEDDEDKLVISEGNERGTEESADENSKGEGPVILAKQLSRSPTPKAGEKRPADDDVGREAPAKRPRQIDEPVSLNSLTSISQVESCIGQIRKDIEAIEFLVKQKEEEWNQLIILQKRKEELYLRLVRKRNVLLLKGSPSEDSKGEEDPPEENSSGLLFMPQPGSYSLGGPQIPLMMMNQLFANSVSPHNVPSLPHVTSKSESNRGSSLGNGNTNISIIDIHTQNNKPGGEAPRVSMSSEAHSKLSKQLTSGLASMKPILPKPPATSSSLTGLPPSLSFTATGHGPQGPTVNVQQLIAAHRKENPNTPPIRRATRGAWRHRYDGDKRSSREHDRPPSVSSSSSDADTRTTPSNKNLLAMSDPSVSYKDVLLRFAELTQIEKQPGSPQISIFPVGNVESSAKRSESSRESTPANRDQTPPLPPNIPPPPTSKSSLEAPSALAKLLLESRNNASGGASNKSGLDTVTNSQYLTLSALLSGGSTTTVKEKSAAHSQVESRSKKSNHQEEGSGNPKCQGCHKQRAQFVCAGCGNQWYCSRDCQVAAWEEHSEHCSN